MRCCYNKRGLGCHSSSLCKGVSKMEEIIKIFLSNRQTAYCHRRAKSIEDISVCSGMSDLYENCIFHNAIKFFIHENYNKLNNDYDIAVVQVFPPFTFNDRTKAVDLARGNAQETSTECGITCGWGYYMVMIKRILTYIAIPFDLQSVERIKLS